MGKTCKLKDVSFQCMTQFTTNKKKKKKKIFYTNVYFFFCKDYNNKEQQKAKVKVKETDPTWSENWLFPAAF